MSPIANNEHQSLVSQFTAVLQTIIDWNTLGRTLCGANVSDRRDDWTKNYRVPDVLVFLNHTHAEDCETHWYGGPDFAIEIVSEGDRTLEKLEFYASVGTKELLVIDRHPWQLTLYRADNTSKLVPAAISSPTQQAIINSEVLPVRISFELEPPCIRLSHESGDVIRDIPIRA